MTVVSLAVALFFGIQYPLPEQPEEPVEPIPLGAHFTNPVDITGSSSASAPALTFEGDTDTGILRPTTNTLSIAAGGIEYLKINSGTITLQGALYTSFTDLAVSDGDTITPTYTTYALDTTGAVTVTLAASGQEGQLLAIINDDANATVIADTNLRSSDGNAITLAGAHDIALFVYQDSEWLEVSTIADS